MSFCIALQEKHVYMCAWVCYIRHNEELQYKPVCLRIYHILFFGKKEKEREKLIPTMFKYVEAWKTDFFNFLSAVETMLKDWRHPQENRENLIISIIIIKSSSFKSLVFHHRWRLTVQVKNVFFSRVIPNINEKIIGFYCNWGSNHCSNHVHMLLDGFRMAAL